MKEVFKYIGIKPDWGCKRLESRLNQACIKSKNPILLHCLPDDDRPCIYYYEAYRKLDGNDMVIAINAMQEKGDLKKFSVYTEDVLKDCIEKEILTAREFKTEWIIWLFGKPTNFFKLMEEAIKEKVIGRNE